MAQSVTELTGNEFQDFTKKGLVLVDFWADWCMPCLTMAPVVDELSKKFREKIKFAKVNVDENHVISGRYDIMGVPTILYFRGGRMIDKTVGAVPKEVFRQKIREVFAV